MQRPSGTSTKRAKQDRSYRQEMRMHHTLFQASRWSAPDPSLPGVPKFRLILGRYIACGPEGSKNRKTCTCRPVTSPPTAKYLPRENTEKPRFGGQKARTLRITSTRRQMPQETPRIRRPAAPNTEACDRQAPGEQERPHEGVPEAPSLGGRR